MRHTTRFSPTLLLVILGFLFLCQAFPAFNLAVCGRTKQAIVTQVTYDNPIDKDGHLIPVTSVHYQFTDIIPASRPCHTPPIPFQRNESASLDPNDPVPSVGDTIKIEYAPNTPGVSRVWHYHNPHQKLMLTLMAIIFAVATLAILRRNKNTGYHPNWNA